MQTPDTVPRLESHGSMALKLLTKGEGTLHSPNHFEEYLWLLSQQ